MFCGAPFHAGEAIAPELGSSLARKALAGQRRSARLFSVECGRKGMCTDKLMPLKKVMGELGVSRPTLWRATKAVPGFPTPTIVHGRVFWRADQLLALREAMDRYAGRSAFEKARLHSRLRTERDLVRRKRSRRRTRDLENHADLFEWARDS